MAVTKDEFIQMHKSVTRRETRRGLVLISIGWGLPVALFIGGKELLGNSATEEFFISLVTINRHLLFAGFGAMVLTVVLAVTATLRNSGGVKCPKCGKPVSSTLTLLTSNCGRCGERIIS